MIQHFSFNLGISSAWDNIVDIKQSVSSLALNFWLVSEKQEDCIDMM